MTISTLVSKQGSLTMAKKEEEEIRLIREKHRKGNLKNFIARPRGRRKNTGKKREPQSGNGKEKML